GLLGRTAVRLYSGVCGPGAGSLSRALSAPAQSAPRSPRAGTRAKPPARTVASPPRGGRPPSWQPASGTASGSARRQRPGRRCRPRRAASTASAARARGVVGAAIGGGVVRGGVCDSGQIERFVDFLEWMSVVGPFLVGRDRHGNVGRQAGSGESLAIAEFDGGGGDAEALAGAEGEFLVDGRLAGGVGAENQGLITFAQHGGERFSGA